MDNEEKKPTLTATRDVRVYTPAGGPVFQKEDGTVISDGQVLVLKKGESVLLIEEGEMSIPDWTRLGLSAGVVEQPKETPTQILTEDKNSDYQHEESKEIPEVSQKLGKKRGEQ